MLVDLYFLCSELQSANMCNQQDFKQVNHLHVMRNLIEHLIFVV